MAVSSGVGPDASHVNCRGYPQGLRAMARNPLEFRMDRRCPGSSRTRRTVPLAALAEAIWCSEAAPTPLVTFGSATWSTLLAVDDQLAAVERETRDALRWPAEHLGSSDITATGEAVTRAGIIPQLVKLSTGRAQVALFTVDVDGEH